MKRLLLTATAMAALCGATFAADELTEYEVVQAPVMPASTSFYVAGRLGMAFQNKTTFSTLGTSVTNEYDNPRLTGSAAIGASFASWGVPLRGELEIGGYNARVKSHTIAGVGTFSGPGATGDTSVLYGLANLYYDFNMGNGVKPFFGFGIGGARTRFKDHGASATGIVMNTSDTRFAWQLGGGVAYDLGQYTVELAYKYLDAGKARLQAVDGTVSNARVTSHHLTAGARFNF